MRTFKMKFLRTLTDPEPIRVQGGWLLPIGFDSRPFCLCYKTRVAAHQDLSELRGSLAVSLYPFRSHLVRPVVHAEGRITREVEVNCVR